MDYLYNEKVYSTNNSRLLGEVIGSRYKYRVYITNKDSIFVIKQDHHYHWSHLPSHEFKQFQFGKSVIKYLYDDNVPIDITEKIVGEHLERA